MSDGTDVAEAAVRVIAAVGATAADALGGGAARLVVDLVRSRLHLAGEERAGAAVGAVAADPQDQGARTEVLDALVRVLAADPGFRTYLAGVVVQAQPSARQVAPPPSGPIDHSIVVDHGASAKGNFALRDVVVNKIRTGGTGTLAVVVIGLAALLAATVYGGSKLVTSSGATPFARPGVGGHRAAVLNDLDTGRSVLPDLHAMPTGWTLLRDYPVSRCQGAASACPGVLSIGRIDFHNPYDQDAVFLMAAFSSVEEAKAGFATALGNVGDGGGGTPLAIPAFGDQSSAVKQSSSTVTSVVRVGTVVLQVDETGANDDFELKTLENLTRMFAARSQEAQDGVTPTARAEEE
ncbi:hypothetical protein GCM10009665_27940 [Kitasatospora nipponensis]|uniref:Uncharacterized protein n=1 Tax=Kitasatospora nipponensis TaxID=258049 RepID=A0ABP4GT89_9ACTN